MKTPLSLMIGVLLLGLLIACGGEDNDNKSGDGTGTLVFAGRPMEQAAIVASIAEKKLLAEDAVHTMHTANFKGWITEIWVSQGLVADGVTDDFVWHKIGESDELKAVENYSFTASGLPIGEYKSIKMIFKNTMVRVAVYANDLDTEVEMRSSLSEEGCGDETTIAQFFSESGSHISEGGVFKVMSEGEKVGVFTIREGKTTSIYWKLGGPDAKITDCTFDWVDSATPGVWDCGVDKTQNFNCSVPSVMFSFIVEEE